MKKKEIITNIIWFGGLIIILVVLKTFVFTSTFVSGSSMNPTMVDRERAIALKNQTVNRFDVVTFPAPDDPSKNYIKRVIGLPGDTVEYKNDQLYINGKKMDEPYLNMYKENVTEGTVPNGLPLTKDFDLEEVLGTTTVPEGEIFVMGDNRQNSKDSRMVGFIKEDEIIGNIKFIYWPPQKWGVFNQGIE